MLGKGGVLGVLGKGGVLGVLREGGVQGVLGEGGIIVREGGVLGVLGKGGVLDVLGGGGVRCPGGGRGSRLKMSLSILNVEGVTEFKCEYRCPAQYTDGVLHFPWRPAQYTDDVLDRETIHDVLNILFLSSNFFFFLFQIVSSRYCRCRDTQHRNNTLRPLTVHRPPKACRMLSSCRNLG